MQKEAESTPVPISTAPKPIPQSRPGYSRSNSNEEKRPGSPGSSPSSRRGSWFSNISSKFSSSGAGAGQVPPQASNASPKPAELSVPKANPAKNAVLQHATRHEGEGPYTPAPPKSSQAGILHVFRRLSVSNGSLSPSHKTHNHGLVERRVLNVDPRRERCDISGLNQAKLRRVAFCVDVEIAPMPKYADADAATKKVCEKEGEKPDQTQKRKLAEKAEGAALKSAHPAELPKEEESEPKAAPQSQAEGISEEPRRASPELEIQEAKPLPEAKDEAADPAADKISADKKKEKKKKSEEERKARKEKKRKLAEANGSIPMEIHLDSDASDTATATPLATPKVQLMPTTNPVRIYRRCCQLRETPILKKITEQLTNAANYSAEAGIVERLDLTGYWMQLADLVTLGDYLAVVPIREVILENCGLTDEGLRVILAGLLAVHKSGPSKRKIHPNGVDGLVHQGGMVEKLVLKNNKIGPEGWKHLSLFIYLCRTLTTLDLSSIPFPKSPATATDGNRQPLDLPRLFAKSLGERLSGSTLTLLNIGETGLDTQQLEPIINGVMACGVKRLGLARNDIDADGLRHVARFLAKGAECLDIAGNNLRENISIIADALKGDQPIWALSLAECNLEPVSLSKLFLKLVPLKALRFIDLSHNPDLFNSEPNAVKLLRRYLPLFTSLKRLHLSDCALNPSQAMAIAEILPEVPNLAHISLLENPELVALTNASTDDARQEAVALFASLLAAARISTTLVAVEIEVPNEQSGDLVRAMARQVVAYCLRNMARVPLNELAVAAMAQTEEAAKIDPEYPTVLQHLVGHDVMKPSELDTDVAAAPDDDYLIGGSGVVKALACCLANHGYESDGDPAEPSAGLEEGGIAIPRGHGTGGKARETSKHLLSSARKIRDRLRPAIAKAKLDSATHTHAYSTSLPSAPPMSLHPCFLCPHTDSPTGRLLFLDNTLKGIIKRFEDEFPDTRESIDSGIGMSSSMTLGSSISSGDAELYRPNTNSDDGDAEVEDEADLSLKSPSLARSDSVLSTTSKALANEEAKILRAGHKFRVGILKPEHWVLLSGLEEVAANPNHIRMLHEMLDDLDNEDLKREAEERGVVPVFEEHREELLQKLKEDDPEYWERFVESQVLARANANLERADSKHPATVSESAVQDGPKSAMNESAIED